MKDSDKTINVALADEVSQLLRFFEDFQHQIKGPISQAHCRARATLLSEQSNDEIRTQLHAIRSLCGKARQITSRISLFVSLSRGQTIPAHLLPLEGANLLSMLTETADDNQVMIEPDREVSHSIDTNSFQVMESCQPMADAELLEQALRSILDNAGKYSYPNSVIKIHGGLTSENDFYISIANHGIPLRATDLESCPARGWRSDEAKATTGEGSGLGLWIVDNIMKAQGGRLGLTPTSEDGITDVRLILGCAKASSKP